MNEHSPQITALIIDSRIHVIETMDGVIIQFLLLPWGNDEPTEARPSPPLGLNLDEAKKLRASLDEVIGLMERSPGPSGTAQ